MVSDDSAPREPRCDRGLVVYGKPRQPADCRPPGARSGCERELSRDPDSRAERPRIAAGRPEGRRDRSRHALFGFIRTAVQSLRPFPHMLNIGYLNVPAGNSFYHAMRARLEKRFTDGAILQASYTWSKLTGMGAGRLHAGDGLGRGPQNPTDTQALERGLSAQDVPHRILAALRTACRSFSRRGPALRPRCLAVGPYLAA